MDDPTHHEYGDRALIILVTAATHPKITRERLARLPSEDTIVRDRRAAVAEALAYTALGDHAAARAVAHGFEDDEEHASTVLAALAGHAAHAAVDLGGLIAGGGGVRASLARRLAALLHPRPPARIPPGPDPS